MMTTRGFWVLLAALALAFSSLMAFADDYYIDPENGSDSTGGGSATAPWKTLTYANSQTKCQGTEENPVALHALAGVYSPSTNGETFPIEFQQYNTYPPGGGPATPHYGILLGVGPHATIFDGEETELVLHTSGYYIAVSGLTITGGNAGGMRNSITSIMGSSGSFTLERCIIKDNSGGDGLKVFDAGAVKVNDCVFTGNQDVGVNRGGAIALDPRQKQTITNCLIADNSTTAGQGGGIVIEWGCRTTLINCTMARNSKHGIYAMTSNYYVKLYNCILWNNEDDICIEGGVPCEIYHCNISDGDGQGENGNISQDPLFVTGAQGDYYLAHAGVNAKKKEAKNK
ncbi:MAG TPA: right-handed parallel beta-helix repeat-containing protein [bacterium]|nr:right-handed parallel beta-helix repeat-containing protein [bacterium]